MQVELSLQSGFSKGMKLEAPNKNSPNTYWVATIVMTCGPLLRLRYEGYDDNSSADFWSDPMTSDIHPLGWCEEKGKSLQPPEGTIESIITGQISAEGRCMITLVDRLRVGMLNISLTKVCLLFLGERKPFH